MFLHSRTWYQRNSNGYAYVFEDRLSIGTHENTMRPNRKWKKPIWRSQVLVFSTSTHENTMRPNRNWNNTSRRSPENSAFPRGVTRARPAIEGIDGSRGGWDPIRHFLNHVEMSWWNEITIRLICKHRSRTGDQSSPTLSSLFLKSLSHKLGTRYDKDN